MVYIVGLLYIMIFENNFFSKKNCDKEWFFFVIYGCYYIVKSIV